MPDISLERPRTALLIADFYAAQMSELEHATSRGCTDKAVAVREAARKAGLLVLYSATVFRTGYPEIGGQNKIFTARKNAGAPAVADPLKLIHPKLQPAGNEIVIGKHRVNAMYGTDLPMVLRANNIHTLIMMGFATTGVILSTTRYAADEDYRIVIVEDCCADFEREVHDFLMRKVLSRQADIVQSSELIKALA